MKRLAIFKEKRQNQVIDLIQKKSIKGGIREFLEKNTGNPVNHARYAKACRQAQNIMLVEINGTEYFCIDW